MGIASVGLMSSSVHRASIVRPPVFNSNADLDLDFNTPYKYYKHGEYPQVCSSSSLVLVELDSLLPYCGSRLRSLGLMSTEKIHIHQESRRERADYRTGF